jgi:hypothetical protein
MNIPPALLSAFPPSSSLLLDVTRRDVDDSMLEEIAWADYGHKADEYLSGLKRIRDQGIVPKSMGWDRAEVLELIRWCDPDQPAQEPGSPGPRGHQMRAFSCAVLLVAAAEAGGDSDEATLAQCLRSAKVLGGEVNEAAARFLTWRIPTVTCADEWLFALGLLIVAPRFESDRISSDILGAAAAWFLDVESTSRREDQPTFNAADPRPAAFGLTYGFWTPLITELIENTATLEDVRVRAEMEMIGKILLAES